MSLQSYLDLDKEPDAPLSVQPLEGEPYTIHAPFHCLCCGIPVARSQFAFGACCGRCDVGACDKRNRAHRPEAEHGDPPWWEPEPNVSPISHPDEWMARKKRIWDRFQQAQSPPEDAQRPTPGGKRPRMASEIT